MALRLAYLMLARVLSWLALLACSDAAKDVVAIQLLPLTSAARSAPPRAGRWAARRRSSVGGRVPVLRAAAACALWLVGLV